MEKHINEKGITLIALIITIIVMLILVAVTVSVTLNGGLIEKAKTATEQTQRQVSKEQLIVAMLGAYDNNANFVKGDVVLPEGAKWCTENETNYENASGTGNWIITENGNKFYVDGSGNVLDEKPAEEGIETGDNWYNVTFNDLREIDWTNYIDGEDYMLGFENSEGVVSAFIFNQLNAQSTPEVYFLPDIEEELTYNYSLNTGIWDRN